MTAVVAAPTARGLGTGEPDLWCTYAAVRTLAWLDRTDAVEDRDGTVDYLAGRRNADGGYGWSRGMPSDAWATFYCTQAMSDLGARPPAVDLLRAWLDRTWSGDAYAMTPEQAPDVWATHFTVRTVVDVCDSDVPDADRLLGWLRRLQTPSGGLGWAPPVGTSGGADSPADVRACYYGIAAWRALARRTPAPPPWDVDALTAWLWRQQLSRGGFRFGPGADVPCLWATYRATAALDLLGVLDHATAGPATSFVLAQRGPAGGFVRWPGYPVEDVWAAFSAVGTLRATSGTADDVAAAVVARIADFACAGGGFTYREPSLAWDALTTAAAVLRQEAGSRELTSWLERCQLPNEGGVMYMPGRGSEIRCTTWALAAGAFADDPAGRARIGAWLRGVQNADGGFGFWEGRASDLVSTASAVATAAMLRRPLDTVLDVAALAAFVRACPPQTPPQLRPALQVLRIRDALGEPDPAEVMSALRRHKVSGGGFAAEGNRVPDLLSTYEAVLAGDLHGVALDEAHLRRFVERVSTAQRAAWSPLAPPGTDPLAGCLAALLRRRLDDRAFRLPPVALS